MINCPQCSHRFSGDTSQPPTHCPECGAALPHEPTQWVPVARLADLAESGYFSELLRQRGINVRVHESDEFSALLGRWEAVFVLQSPRDDAQRAIDLVREELESGRADTPEQVADAVESESYYQTTSADDDVLEWPGAEQTMHGSHLWKSVALVLVAGGIAYGVGHSTALREAADVPSEDRDMLWQALSKPGETFVTEGPPGVRRYRLRYDVPSDQIHMEEDTDGDGRYDKQQVFDRGRLINSR